MIGSMVDCLKCGYPKRPEVWYNQQFGPNHDKIEGWLEWEVQRAVFNAAMYARDGLVIEIGSYHGLSTNHLAAGAKLAGTGKVIAIEPGRDPGGGGTNASDYFTPALIANLEKCGVRDVVDHWEMLSAQAAERFASEHTSPCIEVLFIDGDHTFDGVNADFQGFRRFMLPGGLVMFHDRGFPGPGELIGNLLKDPSLEHSLIIDSMEAFIVK